MGRATIFEIFGFSKPTLVFLVIGLLSVLLLCLEKQYLVTIEYSFGKPKWKVLDDDILVDLSFLNDRVNEIGARLKTEPDLIGNDGVELKNMVSFIESNELTIIYISQAFHNLNPERITKRLLGKIASRSLKLTLKKISDEVMVLNDQKAKYEYCTNRPEFFMLFETLRVNGLVIPANVEQKFLEYLCRPSGIENLLERREKLVLVLDKWRERDISGLELGSFKVASQLGFDEFRFAKLAVLLFWVWLALSMAYQKVKWNRLRSSGLS